MLSVGSDDLREAHPHPTDRLSPRPMSVKGQAYSSISLTCNPYAEASSVLRQQRGLSREAQMLVLHHSRIRTNAIGAFPLRISHNEHIQNLFLKLNGHALRLDNKLTVCVYSGVKYLGHGGTYILKHLLGSVMDTAFTTR